MITFSDSSNGGSSSAADRRRAAYVTGGAGAGAPPLYGAAADAAASAATAPSAPRRTSGNSNFSPSIEGLPSELLAHVIEYLDPSSRAAITATCATARNAVHEVNNFVFDFVNGYTQETIQTAQFLAFHSANAHASPSATSPSVKATINHLSQFYQIICDGFRIHTLDMTHFPNLTLEEMTDVFEIVGPKCFVSIHLSPLNPDFEKIVQLATARGKDSYITVSIEGEDEMLALQSILKSYTAANAEAKTAAASAETAKQDAAKA